MADNKKYYWLKLKSDFFEDDTIQFIEEQENGMLYVNFYLKLCLKSLKYDGKLIRFIGNTLMPYDGKSLSKLTNTDVDTVRVAMELFKQIGLVEILDSGEIYLSQINEMIGSESAVAERVRKHRLLKSADKKALQCNTNVTQELPNGNTEIEYRVKSKENRVKSIEYRGEEDNTPTKPTKHKHGEYSNVLLTDDEYIKINQDYPNAEELITFLDEYIEMKGYKAKSHYLAIKKWVVNAVAERKPKHKKDVYTLHNGSETSNPFLALLEEEENE